MENSIFPNHTPTQRNEEIPIVLSLASLLTPEQRLWLAGTVLLATLALVIIRPRGLNVAWAAGVGAVVTLALGLLGVRSLTTIFGDTWDAAATLIALFILSETLDSNGFFAWAARRLARLANGSGWRLYGLTLLLTSAVAALLANNGAVLMLTPILAKLLAQIYPEARLRLPYLFAAGFFADAMSGLFIPSNLTNIIIADAAHLSVIQSVGWTILPTQAAFVVAGGAFALRFRARLSTRFDVAVVGELDEAIRDRFVFWVGWVALGALVVGYVIRWPATAARRAGGRYGGAGDVGAHHGASAPLCARDAWRSAVEHPDLRHRHVCRDHRRL